MKKKILVTKNLLKETEERVQKLFDTKLNKEEKLYTTEDIIELSKDCDGILSFSSDKIDYAASNKISFSVNALSNNGYLNEELFLNEFLIIFNKFVSIFI
jgi:lactate dehydrogenase-like 2-hydroxyacid dehydrogenase